MGKRKFDPCTVWVKKSPVRFCGIFPKRLGIFRPNFTCLCVPIYARLQIFIQLSATLTKLCYIKRDHPVHTSDQWRTEDGLEPLPLAYDLRNKRVRMRRNMVLSTKNTKNSGHSPSPTLPQWRGGYRFQRPTSLGACGTSNPPILKSWVRHWFTPCVQNVHHQPKRTLVFSPNS